ncbi:HAD family hydrolase [Rhabdaerophilum calidifontis]|uniref:HAD family hydrolase n=1 Tax=Rhabdaerophilum calidifontis TaxID=2604328 RepID=UPI00123B1CD5|nr:HAD family phosphatase [Rhabdaerophilum calidifontis]
MEHALIYDCDGTLVDSEHIAGSVCAEALTAIGHPISLEVFNARFTGVPAARTWEILAGEIGRPLPDGFNAAIDAEIHRRFDAELQAIPGAAEAVRAIGGPRAVASSTRLERLRVNLARTGLADLFDPHIYSASQVARGKPAPDVFLYAASQIGVDPGRAIVVEDSANGVVAARRAGMAVIGFTGASNGIRDLGERLTAAGAEMVIDRMADLPAAVERLRRGL